MEQVSCSPNKLSSRKNEGIERHTTYRQRERRSLKSFYVKCILIIINSSQCFVLYYSISESAQYFLNNGDDLWLVGQARVFWHRFFLLLQIHKRHFNANKILLFSFSQKSLGNSFSPQSPNAFECNIEMIVVRKTSLSGHYSQSLKAIFIPTFEI